MFSSFPAPATSLSRQDWDDRYDFHSEYYSSMQSARKYYDYLIVSFVVIQDICTRLAPEFRTSSTTHVWGRYRDLLPGKSPPCLHLFPPPPRHHLWPRPETMATTRTAPSFSHMCPAQDMEPTSPCLPKPSSSLFSSRSEPIQVRSL